MGYTAEAVGNHDFDFGSVDSPTARQLPGDLRGALKARAAQARYPFLAANVIDDATGRPVEWPNVRPSVLVDAAGVKVGVLGVMTIDALRSTLAANVQGLRIAPLGPAIAAEASKLRAAGAEVVIVAVPCGRALRSIRSARGSFVVRIRVRDLSGGEKPAPWVGGRHRRRSHARRARPSGRRDWHYPALLAWPGARSRRRRLRSEDPQRREDPALRSAPDLRPTRSHHRELRLRDRIGSAGEVRRTSGDARSGDRPGDGAGAPARS